MPDLTVAGAFTVGILVSGFGFTAWSLYGDSSYFVHVFVCLRGVNSSSSPAHKVGPWIREEAGEESWTAFWRNVFRAFNPWTNLVEVIWRPAVRGVGGGRFGSGKTIESLAGVMDEGASGTLLVRFSKLEQFFVKSMHFVR